MLCVMSHIHEYLLVIANEEHMKQVNVFKTTFFHVISDDDINDTIDMFWIYYQPFNNNNGPSIGDDFIWSRKYIPWGKSHIWHQKNSLSCTKALGFSACRATSKIIGIGDAERYWGDVKTIKYVKRSDISSNISEYQSIVCTSACIESGRISWSELGYNIDECYPRHVFDDDDEGFDERLDNGVLEILEEKNHHP